MDLVSKNISTDFPKRVGNYLISLENFKLIG